MLIGAGAAAAVACYFLYSRSAKQPTIKIGYWAIRGLGAPCRMAAAYGGIPYESVEYEVHKLADGSWSRSSWLTDAKPALVEQNAMMNLPYVVDGDLAAIALRMDSGTSASVWSSRERASSCAAWSEVSEESWRKAPMALASASSA